jgi:hypothetical protein
MTEYKKSWQHIYMTREEQGQGITARTWKKQTTIHKESRLTPFQEGEDDEDISSIPINHDTTCVSQKFGI